VLDGNCYTGNELANEIANEIARRRDMENTARPIVVDTDANQIIDDVASPQRALADVKAEIASDAASAPAEYLRDSIVPEGGE
jgi:hypothetical protein